MHGDEARLLRALRAAERASPAERALPVPIAAGLGLTRRACLLILDDWAHRGWWDYGTAVCNGWLTERAPA